LNRDTIGEGEQPLRLQGIRSAEAEAAGQETPTGMLVSGEAGAGMPHLHRSDRPDAVAEGTAQRREDRPEAAEAVPLNLIPFGAVDYQSKAHPSSPYFRVAC